MNRAEFSREFPVEKAPVIVRANGSVSRAALRWHFSGVGCPNASPEIAAAAIKAGSTPAEAVHLAILAAYYSGPHGPSIDSIARTCDGIQHAAKRKHAAMFPSGKCAEDFLAAREGRPSRWGTPEFHRGAQVQS